MPSDRWTITLTSTGGTVPAVCKVRKLLKAAAWYGLKAVSVVEDKASDGATGKPDNREGRP